MASFPTSVVALTNPNSGDLLTSPSHASQHANANDEIEAIETFLLNEELDYVQITSNVSITATTAATANICITGSAVAYDGSTVIMVEVNASIRPDGGGAGRTLIVVLYDGSIELGKLGQVENQVTGVTNTYPLNAKRRLTPSAASHTYSIRAYVSAGTGLFLAGAGTAGVAMPAFMQIIRVL